MEKECVRERGRERREGEKRGRKGKKDCRGVPIGLNILARFLFPAT